MVQAVSRILNDVGDQIGLNLRKTLADAVSNTRREWQ
jgi:hypothetical protein